MPTGYGQEMTLFDFDNFARKIQSATWATLAIANQLKEPQFGAAHHKTATPTALIASVSTLELAGNAMINQNGREGVALYTVELRRVAFTSWKLPMSLLDATLREGAEGTREMVHTQIGDSQEDMA